MFFGLNCRVWAVDFFVFSPPVVKHTPSVWTLGACGPLMTNKCSLVFNWTVVPWHLPLLPTSLTSVCGQWDSQSVRQLSSSSLPDTPRPHPPALLRSGGVPCSPHPGCAHWQEVVSSTFSYCVTQNPPRRLNLQNWLLRLRECFPFKQTVPKMAEN